MFSYWLNIALALSVSVSQWLIAPPTAFGQTISTDTAAAEPSDSLTAAAGDSLAAPDDTLALRDTLAAPGDSLAASGYTGSLTPPDTVDTIPGSGSDSVPAAGSADTARSPSDSVAAAARDTTRPAAPVDSILGAACGGPGSSATIARDLLLVVFAPEAGAAERAAAAEGVGGRVLGSAEPGAYYIKLPAGSGEVGLRAAADLLSLRPEVRQVGSRACPPASP